MKTSYFTILILIFLIFGCGSPDPNSTLNGEDEFKSLELDRALSKNDKRFEDIIYVPIYSDVYIDRMNQNSLLTATLSIRNTSLNDSLFVTSIDYYNTVGDLVKKFVDQPIGLAPMATVNYVIEKEDTSGGAGANFIVMLNSNNNIKPLLQAVMIGENGNKGFAFITDGYSVK